MTDLMTMAQAAAHIHRPVTTMRDWRYKGVGPRSAKVGGRVVYRKADLDAWIDAQFAKGIGDDLGKVGA